MRLFCLALPLLALAIAASHRDTTQAARTTSLETIDLMPLYWAFDKRANGAPMDEQVRLFREMVIERRPEVYNAAVLGTPGGQSLESLLPALYPQAAAMAAKHRAVMQKLSLEIANRLGEHVASFRHAFPDLAFEGPVYFMYSLGAFDGAERQVEGRRALLFGIDVIAAIHGKDASVAPLFHHELFHVYHARGQGGPGRPLFQSLWAEGLATLAARHLNPEASEAAIFGLPPNTPERVLRELPALAAHVRARLDSTAQQDYAELFLGNESDAPIPRRSGYVLGYLVARRLQQDGRSLRELAQLEGSALRNSIDEALKDPDRLRP
jgi:hypothetical protein